MSFTTTTTTITSPANHLAAIAADAAAGILSSLPVRKRKQIGSGDDENEEHELQQCKIGGAVTAPPTTICDDDVRVTTTTTTTAAESRPGTTPTSEHSGHVSPSKSLNKEQQPGKARDVRLEQNRKAARESRRRKKVMIEELQRSVIFFSRANGTLKQQNAELTSLLIRAQAQISPGHGQSREEGEQARVEKKEADQEQAQAHTVATQALYESQGFPAAAARSAAQTINDSCPAPTQPLTVAPIATAASTTLPSMQPGATMQAMANFQQAAAAAMQAAVQGMQSNPGVNMGQLAMAPAGTNAQQAYTDAMTALAMQQAAAAAAAAAGQQYLLQAGQVPFFPHAMMAWQHHQQQQQAAIVMAQQHHQQQQQQQIEQPNSQVKAEEVEY